MSLSQRTFPENTRPEDPQDQISVLASASMPEEVDYIIVGAGSAGCVLAARLTEDPQCRVLLLEAGGANDQPELRVPAISAGLAATEGFTAAYPNLTIPQEALGGRRIALTTGRGLGGGSTINAMGWFQGYPEDFDGWRDGGATGWGWSETLPYLRRSEQHELGPNPVHGAGGPMSITLPRYLHPLTTTFLEAATSVGWPLNEDLNGAVRDGIGLAQSNIRDGERHSVVDGYLRPALGREHLTVRINTAVQRLIVHAGRVVGVLTDGAEIRARKSVILSAGSLRTPQLLMVSGIGPADQLRQHGIDVHQDLPGVGTNLHDHPTVVVMWPVKDVAAAGGSQDQDPQRAYRLLRRGPLSSVGQSVAVLRSDARLALPDLQYALIPQLPFPEPTMGCQVALLTPASRGSVRLNSGDMNDPPAVDPRYLHASEDRDRLRIGVERILEVFNAPALGTVAGPPLLPAALDPAGLDAFLTQYAAPYYHPVGTARMGTGAGSVVDPRLAVHGIEGLHVVDASVIPTIPRANTQASIVAIAERAAEMLSQR
jgi:choline dehydrogenase